jgi:hypothetical protein
MPGAEARHPGFAPSGARDATDKLKEIFTTFTRQTTHHFADADILDPFAYFGSG